MKIYDLAFLRMRGNYFLIFLYLFLCCLSCNTTSVIINNNNHFNITESSISIDVKTRLYSLSISKNEARAHLKNLENQEYTSFPLDIHFPGASKTEKISSRYAWKLKSKTIFLDYFVNDSLVQKYQIKCSNNSFVIDISSKIPNKIEL